MLQPPPPHTRTYGAGHGWDRPDSLATRAETRTRPVASRRAANVILVLAVLGLVACSGTDPATPTDSPQSALATYQAALADQADLTRAPFLTPGSQVLIAAWDPSPGQMRAEAGRLEDCRPLGPVFAPDHSRAVIVFDGSQPECSPYFFLAAGNGWHLDLEAMATAIVFDQDNHWRVDAELAGEYAFAFVGSPAVG